MVRKIVLAMLVTAILTKLTLGSVIQHHIRAADIGEGHRPCRPDQYYQCQDGGCLPYSDICNGEGQCADDEDEMSCEVEYSLNSDYENYGENPRGVVVVTQNGIDGSICNHGWNRRRANAICIELGYTSGISVETGPFDTIDGPFWDVSRSSFGARCPNGNSASVQCFDD